MTTFPLISVLPGVGRRRCDVSLFHPKFSYFQSPYMEHPVISTEPARMWLAFLRKHWECSGKSTHAS
jgi:hypothetical protein